MVKLVIELSWSARPSARSDNPQAVVFPVQQTAFEFVEAMARAISSVIHSRFREKLHRPVLGRNLVAEMMRHRSWTS